MAAAAAVLLALAVLPTPSAAASAGGGAGAGPGGGSAASSSLDLRARRTDLLVRIAELTDKLENTQANVVAAQLDQTRVEDQAAAVRDRVRARAVSAYIHGKNMPDKLAAPNAYLRVTARKERNLLDGLRRAKAEVAERRASAEAVRGELRTVAVELNRSRVELDGLVAADDARIRAERLAQQQAAEMKAAAEARRRAQAAAEARRRAQAAAASAAADALGRVRSGAGGGGGGGGDGGGGGGGGSGTGIGSATPADQLAALAVVPRHVEATRRQAELMTRYPFGVLPPGPLPPSLRATGQVTGGTASWYCCYFNGRPTATGAIYDEDGWTAASRTLPLGTMVVVTRGSVRVLLLVNDRGPYVEGRVIDLSAAAARALDVGVSDVQIEVVTPTAR